MAELFTIKIDGLKELEARLLKLTKKSQGKCLRKALAAGGRVIVKQAKANCPVGATKKLKKSITAKVTVKGGGKTPVRVPSGELIYVDMKKQAHILIGYTTAAWYGGFVERGTSQKPARAYLRPAIDVKSGEAVEAFKNIMEASILKVEQEDSY